ncbi:MAG TPA: arsenate reductase family protein [Syntrophorhabdaceae bacterium]|nr:arsenate reductase family protein [Syntrophorhabdaceae bacterium]
MNIQIFGTLKCQNTRKAQRYFKERNISFHFVDLKAKGLSKGELNSVKRVISLENLIDTESREYHERNLKYMVHDIENELLSHPLLFRTPIVRYGGKMTVGYCPDTWGEWLRQRE